MRETEQWQNTSILHYKTFMLSAHKSWRWRKFKECLTMITCGGISLQWMRTLMIKKKTNSHMSLQAFDFQVLNHNVLSTNININCFYFYKYSMTTPTKSGERQQPQFRGAPKKKSRLGVLSTITTPTKCDARKPLQCPGAPIKRRPQRIASKAWETSNLAEEYYIPSWSSVHCSIYWYNCIECIC